MKYFKYIFILLFAFNLKAQPPGSFYQKFGGVGMDVGYDIKQIYNKQYVIIGSTTSFGNSTDALLILADSMGQPIWSKTFGGVMADVGKSIVFNPLDSGFVFTGYTNSIGNGGYDLWLVRTDKQGNLIWQKSYGGLDWDFGNCVTISSDNQIIACGTLYSSGNGGKDGCVLKYAMGGSLVWEKNFGGINDDELNTIIKTIDNNITVGGYTKSKGEPNGDNYLIKLDLNGDTIFTKTYGGTGFDFINDIIQKPTEEYIFVGGSSSYTTTYTQSFMTCIDKNGLLLWTNHFYDSNNTDEAFVSLSDNIINPIFSYYLRTVPVPAFKMNGNIFYAQALGFPSIVNSFGGYEDEYFYNVSPTSDGGAVCVGYTYSFGSSDKDVFFIKLDSNIISYQSAIGIKENKLDSTTIQCYNKSTRKTIYVENISFENTEILLYNINGELIKHEKNKSENIEFIYSEFNPGIYLVSILQGTKRKNFKILIE